MNKKEKREQIKKIAFQVLITLTVLPLMFFVFTADRLILVCLPHLHGRTFKNWLENNESPIQSILRISGVILIYGLIELIKWIF